MYTTNNTKKYILDTNILINLKVFLPPNKFKLFYDKLFVAIEDKMVVLLDCVCEELKNGSNKELDVFLIKCRDNSLIENTSHLIERSVEINDSYKMIDEISKKSEADPIIIAYCEQDTINNILLTREGYKQPNGEFYKIPDVCKLLAVKYDRKMSNFYEHMGYSETNIV